MTRRFLLLANEMSFQLIPTCSMGGAAVNQKSPTAVGGTSTPVQVLACMSVNFGPCQIYIFYACIGFIETSVYENYGCSRS